MTASPQTQVFMLYILNRGSDVIRPSICGKWCSAVTVKNRRLMALWMLRELERV